MFLSFCKFLFYILIYKCVPVYLQTKTICKTNEVPEQYLLYDSRYVIWPESKVNGYIYSHRQPRGPRYTNHTQLLSNGSSPDSCQAKSKSSQLYRVAFVNKTLTCVNTPNSKSYQET